MDCCPKLLMISNYGYFCARIKAMKIIILIVLIFGLLVVCVTPAVNEPAYFLLETVHDIEIRDYGSRVIATVSENGSRDQASNAGFKKLADYIFKTPERPLPMTAPVTVEASGAGWEISFFMPDSELLQNLPKPSNPRIQLRALAPGRYAVIRFSGLSREGIIAQKTAKLEGFIAQRNFTALSKPVLARYNPPWILPFVRRNEILIKIL